MGDIMHSGESKASKSNAQKRQNTRTNTRLGVRFTHELADTIDRVVASWKKVDNANCVAVHTYFTTRAFGDSSLVFVTDFHPMSRTLSEQHFSHSPPHSHRTSRSSPAIAENTIWGYLVQLSSALQAIHTNNLWARVVHPSKIISNDKNRIYLNANAVMDVLSPLDNSWSRADLQIDDLRQLGRLVLSLVAQVPNPASFTPVHGHGEAGIHSGMTAAVVRALENMPRGYSDRLKSTIMSLIDAGNTSNPSSVHDIISFANSISDHVFSVFNAALEANSNLTSELMRELQNGRIVRNLVKLGMINERPEFSPHDPTSTTVTPSSPNSLQSASWSETGDRYPLKLFRDYVFHQVSAEDGRPVLDLGHIITCLNKMDAGVEEQIALVSRDEQSIGVFSYKEIKHMLESVFQDLRNAANGASNVGMGPANVIGRR